jgi:hypothetical protein
MEKIRKRREGWRYMYKDIGFNNSALKNETAPQG